MTASPDFSSSTLTDLQKAHREIAELRRALRQIANQGCSDGAVCLDGMWRRCSELDGSDQFGWCVGCIASAALAAAPVDGAE